MFALNLTPLQSYCKQLLDYTLANIMNMYYKAKLKRVSKVNHGLNKN